VLQVHHLHLFTLKDGARKLPDTLQLAFGDLNHELHKPTPIMSERITVNVQ
jgi:hypothetical protein